MRFIVLQNLPWQSCFHRQQNWSNQAIATLLGEVFEIWFSWQSFPIVARCLVRHRCWFLHQVSGLSTHLLTVSQWPFNVSVDVIIRSHQHMVTCVKIGFMSQRTRLTSRGNEGRSSFPFVWVTVVCKRGNVDIVRHDLKDGGDSRKIAYLLFECDSKSDNFPETCRCLCLCLWFWFETYGQPFRCCNCTYSQLLTSVRGRWIATWHVSDDELLNVVESPR